MHELYILKEVAERLLLPAGFSLQHEALHPDDFSSYFAVYARPDSEIRFVWDGKDGWGFIERCTPGSGDWRQLGEPIFEGERDSMRDTALEEWRRALAPFL